MPPAILKPPLSRGEIQVIGATTVDEYRKHLEKDSALERRFQPITVGELQRGAGPAHHGGLRDRYEAHHQVHFTDEALQAAVTLSDRYIQDRFLPDKAIDVMDEAGARMRIRNMTLPDELREMDDKLRQIRSDKDKAIAEQDFERAAKLRDQESRCERQAPPEKKWAEDSQKSVHQVTAQDIADVVSMTTGVPVSNLTEAETEKLLRMEGVLHERVIGPGRGRDCAVEGHPPQPRRFEGSQAPRRQLHLPGPVGRGQDRAVQGAAEFLFSS